MTVTFRRGTEADARAAADLWLRARKAAIDVIPLRVHPDEVRAWFASHVVPNTELWIAEDPPGALVGILVLAGPWLDQLYVEPTMTGRGIGGSLVKLASVSARRGSGYGRSHRTRARSGSTSGTASSRRVALRETTSRERRTSSTSGVDRASRVKVRLRRDQARRGPDDRSGPAAATRQDRKRRAGPPHFRVGRKQERPTGQRPRPAR